MWPKVIAQLIEFLPHATRLLPMADKFLSSKVAGERATETALQGLSESFRGDLGKVAKAHMDLANRLDEFAAHVGEGVTEARRARMGVEALEQRIGGLERSVASLRTLLVSILLCVLLVLVLAAVLLFRSR